MNRRSRAGCIDCKRAKVKCDERKPVCGTCSRRGKSCHGYSTESPRKPLKWTAAATSAEGPPLKRRRRCLTDPLVRNERLIGLNHVNNSSNFRDMVQISSPVFICTRSTVHHAGAFDPRWIDNAHKSQAYRDFDQPGQGILQQQDIPNTTSFTSSSIATSPPMLSLPWELSLFSNSNITPETSEGVAIYFARHPPELVIGSDPSFIQEMNSHVLVALQSNVEAMSDSLSAIGLIYLHNEGLKSSLELALRSKIKTLARIRRGTNVFFQGLSIELIMSMILAVVSVELIDNHYRPSDSSMSALHRAAAVLIRQSLCTGSTFSSTAKYMIRALARQEIVMALVHRKRPLIPTTAWLDKNCEHSADRFMGFTATLMPLLNELSGLAEDLQNWYQDRVVSSLGLNVQIGVSEAQSIFDCQASNLRNRISTWHPPYDPTFSGPSSLKYLFHADMYRLAALLYLHRLLSPHGVHDHEGLTLAYKIFAHLSSEPRDNRLALFPIFVASCEFQKVEDRSMAEECFKSIHRSRNTCTTWLTGRFVKERVWRARDMGEEWGWAILAGRWEGECVPI